MSAPSSSALARRISLGSSTVIWLAPPRRRCITVSRPMGPAPTTTARRPTLKPERETPRNATAIGSTHAPSSNETLSGKLRSFPAGMLTYAAMPPLLPIPAVPPMSGALHRLDKPSRHSGHTPHTLPLGCTAARSPARQPSTPGPTDTTSPANSCPITTPSSYLPSCIACKSVPQIPEYRVRNSTSPASGSGIGRSSMAYPPSWLRTRARIVCSPFLAPFWASLFGLAIRWAAPVS